MKTFPQTFDSVTGIGPIFAPGILAKIDICQYKSHKELAKYAGFAWTEYQSGRLTANRTRLIRSGNRYLRYYWSKRRTVSGRTTLFSPSITPEKAEPKEFVGKRALALTARKLVRLVFFLPKINRLYFEVAYRGFRNSVDGDGYEGLMAV